MGTVLEHSDNLHGVVRQGKERETYRGRREKEEGHMPALGVGGGGPPQSVVERVQGANLTFSPPNSFSR